MAVDSIQREDKMELKDMSWKNVVEFYGEELTKDFPEDMWVDPAEEDYPSVLSSTEAD